MVETALALRRVIARRGNIRVIYCDNAKSFHKLSSLATEIEWRFLPECAPWWGGMYERLVAVVKKPLRIVLRNKLLSFTEAATVLAELEERVNRRPLFPLGQNVITPAHFLYGCAPPNLAPRNVSLDEVPLTRRWYHAQRIAESLWKRFKTEYLPTLRGWRSMLRQPSVIGVGDVVLVDDGTKTSRMKWPLAKVQQLIIGTDGECRAVFVMLHGKLTRRPLSRLVLLEVSSPESLPVETVTREKTQVKPTEAALQKQPSEQCLPNRQTRHRRLVRAPVRFQDYEIGLRT
jgi:hypothetical protein